MDTVEQAVIVHLPLKGGAFGSADELARMRALEEEIADAVEGNFVGEFDGNEVGGNEFTLFMYSRDADRLFLTIEPILKSSPAAEGGRATIRYGGVDEPSVREREVTWGAVT